MTSSESHHHDLYLVTETSEERSGRVEEIRRRIAAGSYEVPAGDVADAVVAFFSRGLEPLRPTNHCSDGDTC